MTNLPPFFRTMVYLMIAVYTVLCFSCTTPLREITYLYGLDTGELYEHGPEPDLYKIKPGDLLYISVIGDDQGSTAFLNLLQTSAYISSGVNLDLVTYIVDENGTIVFPQFGAITVGGLTMNQVRDTLQKEVDRILDGASVFVKLTNRSVTVLGEVRKPGQHGMIKNRLTIFETLGLAGDVNEYGNRQNVKIIRETSAGKIYGQIDLTDPGLLRSEFYYILPNDVLYVEPLSRIYGQKTMPFGTGFSIIISSISTTLLLLNFFK
jgi:polysaccharide biosynthesis/export protein